MLDYEQEADRLLTEAGAFGHEHGIYREVHMLRKTAREISQGLDLAWDDAHMIPHRTELTLSEIIHEARLTARQRQCVRLMARMGRQVLVAQLLGVDRSAVSHILYRAFIRIHHALPKMEARQPARWAIRLFWDEIRYKKSLCYRRRITRAKNN